MQMAVSIVMSDAKHKLPQDFKLIHLKLLENMKKLIYSIIIAATVVFSSASYAQTVSVKTNEIATDDAQLLIQAFGSTGKIDVTVEKAAGKYMEIQITDAKGLKLASKALYKKDSVVRTRFDLNALPDGIYHIVVEEGKNKVVREIILDTHNANTFRTITTA
jgi:hypothetical protein